MASQNISLPVVATRVATSRRVGVVVVSRVKSQQREIPSLGQTTEIARSKETASGRCGDADACRVERPLHARFTFISSSPRTYRL